MFVQRHSLPHSASGGRHDKTTGALCRCVVLLGLSGARSEAKTVLCIVTPDPACMQHVSFLHVHGGEFSASSPSTENYVLGWSVETVNQAIWGRWVSMAKANSTWNSNSGVDIRPVQQVWGRSSGLDTTQLIGSRPCHGVSIPCETTVLLLRFPCTSVASPPNGLASLPITGSAVQGLVLLSSRMLGPALSLKSREDAGEGRPQAGQGTGRGRPVGTLVRVSIEG